MPARRQIRIRPLPFTFMAPGLRSWYRPRANRRARRAYLLLGVSAVLKRDSLVLASFFEVLCMTNPDATNRYTMNIGEADLQRLAILGRYYDPASRAFLESIGLGE